MEAWRISSIRYLTRLSNHDAQIRECPSMRLSCVEEKDNGLVGASVFFVYYKEQGDTSGM